MTIWNLLTFKTVKCVGGFPTEDMGISTLMVLKAGTVSDKTWPGCKTGYDSFLKQERN